MDKPMPERPAMDHTENEPSTLAEEQAAYWYISAMKYKKQLEGAQKALLNDMREKLKNPGLYGAPQAAVVSAWLDAYERDRK